MLLDFKQFLELAARQPARASISCLRRGRALDEEVLQNATIEVVGEGQTHRLQQRRHDIIDLSVGGFEAAFEGRAIGVEDAIFVMRTKGLANILPDATVAHLHTEGDAFTRQQQQMRLARRVWPLAVDLGSEYLID